MEGSLQSQRRTAPLAVAAQNHGSPLEGALAPFASGEASSSLKGLEHLRGAVETQAQPHQAHHGGHVEQPLLPHDGPLLSQPQGVQPGQQELHLAPGQDPATHEGLAPAFPGVDMQHLQHWINVLGHLPNSGTFQPAPKLLGGGSLAQVSLEMALPRPAPGHDFRFSPSFQGTGAFAPLRPPHQEQEIATLRSREGGSLALQSGHAFHHLPQNAHEGIPWGASVQPVHEENGLQPSDFSQHGFTQPGQQQPLQGLAANDSALSYLPQGTQQFQAIKPGAEAAGQLSQSGQPHQPPQATKSSRYRGVYKRQRGGRWEASIVHEGKNCRLGLHLTEIAAAKAYDRVAIKKWGPHLAASKINFELKHYDLAELETMSMNDLVQAVRAEWRTREADSRVPGLTAAGVEELRQPVVTGDSQDPPAKRQKLAETDVEASNGMAVENEETHERVPIARSSMYRGVSTHKQSGKWVAQIKCGGKQVYLGFYADQTHAAQAYDQAVIHMQGHQAETNFPIEHYADRMQQLLEMDFKDLVSQLKQQGRGGAPRQAKADSSQFRGVAPDRGKKWRSQITTGVKTTVYLGMWADEEGAARAYDRANLAKRGPHAKTNFPVSDYANDLQQLRAMPFDRLVIQLRSEATASVAADKAARIDDCQPATILAPQPSGEDDGAAQRLRYLPQDGSGPPAAAYGAESGGYGGDNGQLYAAAAQPQIGRFSNPRDLVPFQGYIIGRHASSPDMLFRVINHTPEEEATHFAEHGQEQPQR